MSMIKRILESCASRSRRGSDRDGRDGCGHGRDRLGVHHARVLGAHVRDEVQDPARISPLVVVPCENLGRVLVEDDGGGSVNDAGVRRAAEVG